MSFGSKVLIGSSLAIVGFLIYKKYQSMKNEIAYQKFRAEGLQTALNAISSTQK